MTMPMLRIEDLTPCGLDQSGLQIVEIYARVPPDYCIYRTQHRVCVQFADNPDAAKVQRADLAPLGTLRSDVNGLINGWRQSDRHRDKARARLYDRRCADALVSAFSKDFTSAIYDLTSVRNELITARTGIARYQYIGTALGIVLLTYLILWLTSFPAVTSSSVTATYTGKMLVSIAGGTIGAFMSIATALKDRTVLPNLQWVSNTCDAVLRMLIGIASAAILICLLKGGFGFSIGDPPSPAAHAVDDEQWMRIFAFGFLAGFFERLVPDLLDKAAANVRITPLQDKPPVAAPPSQPQTPTSAPPPPPPAPPAETGDCGSDTPLTDAEATPDAALPPATGGTK